MIAEIETDKATMEVEAVDEGILAKIVVPAGTQDVAVNQLIALIAGEGEDAKAVAAGGGAAAPARALRPLPRSCAAAPAARSGSPRSGCRPGSSGSRCWWFARVFASRSPKRIAKEAGIDLAAVKGSGPHGRVVMADVEAAKAGGGAKAAPAAAPAAAAAPAPAAAAMPSGPSADFGQEEAVRPGSYEEVPHDGMR